jgi:hypothetical protein
MLTCLPSLTGCARPKGIVLRSESVFYFATDQKVDAFVTDDKGEPTRVEVVIPAGSMGRTGGVEMSFEQAARKSKKTAD